MFDAIARLFATPQSAHLRDDPKLAVAALLVHLAQVDGTVDDVEKQAVRGALQDFYGMDEEAVRELIREARRSDADAVDFYRFTSVLKQLDDKARLEIIRMMWQVVFADGKMGYLYRLFLVRNFESFCFKSCQSACCSSIGDGCETSSCNMQGDEPSLSRLTRVFCEC